MTLTETQISNQICGWFRANGVDPRDVLANSYATLLDGRLTFRRFARNERGIRYVDPDAENQLAYETVTVEVVVPPTPFVAEWLRRGAPSAETYQMQLLDAERLSRTVTRER